MRTVYSSSGANVTTSVQSFLQTVQATAGALYLADLYTINMANPWGAAGANGYYCYTSADVPISVGTVQIGPNQLITLNQTWLPNVIERGNLEYSVGLNVTNFEMRWFPDDTLLIPGNAHYTWKEAALSGLLDGCTLFLHRAYFQATAGSVPGALLGTTLMWKGLIQEVEVKAEYIKLSAPSMMQALHDVQVPSQVVQAGHRLAPYSPAGPTTTIGGLNAGASTPFDLHFSSSAADHALQGGFLTPFTGSPSSGVSRPSGVRIVDNFTNGGTMHVFVSDPVDPTALPSTCKVYLPEDISTTATTGALGFPSVPPPEAAV